MWELILKRCFVDAILTQTSYWEERSMRRFEWGGCGYTLQYRYHHEPRRLDKRDRRGFWEVKVSVFILRAKVKTQRGTSQSFSPSFLFLSASHPSVHPSTHLSVLPLFAVLHLLVVVALPSPLSFVQHFDRLHQVALEGGERGADGGSTKAVGEQTEVGEASLDAGLQAGGGPTAAQRRAVLGHQVHKLLTDLPERKRDEALVCYYGTLRFISTIVFLTFKPVWNKFGLYPDWNLK